jgi:hypothetical protein
MPNIPIDFNWAPLLAKILYWIGYFLLAAILCVAFLAAAMYMQYTIKAQVFPLRGSAKKGAFAVGRAKANRFKPNKAGTAWRPLFPLFNNKEVEPFSPEYIYPQKKVYAFKLGDQYIPASLDVNTSGGEMQALITPVPHHIRNWQSLQHKKNAQEYAKHNFWEDNKNIIMTLSAVALCCILAGVTVWLTYKFAAPVRGDIQGLTEALKGVGSIGGIGPR